MKIRPHNKELQHCHSFKLHSSVKIINYHMYLWASETNLNHLTKCFCIVHESRHNALPRKYWDESWPWQWRCSGGSRYWVAREATEADGINATCIPPFRLSAPWMQTFCLPILFSLGNSLTMCVLLYCVLTTYILKSGWNAHQMVFNNRLIQWILYIKSNTFSSFFQKILWIQAGLYGVTALSSMPRMSRCTVRLISSHIVEGCKDYYLFWILTQYTKDMKQFELILFRKEWEVLILVYSNAGILLDKVVEFFILWLY